MRRELEQLGQLRLALRLAKRTVRRRRAGARGKRTKSGCKSDLPRRTRIISWRRAFALATRTLRCARATLTRRALQSTDVDKKKKQKKKKKLRHAPASASHTNRPATAYRLPRPPGRRELPVCSDRAPLQTLGVEEGGGCHALGGVGRLPLGEIGENQLTLGATHMRKRQMGQLLQRFTLAACWLSSCGRRTLVLGLIACATI